MFEVKLDNTNPYSSLIRDMMMLQFPETSAINTKQILEVLTEEVISTSNVRFGPRPTLESLVEIRKVLKLAVVDDRPINLLVPFGSKKPVNGRGVDIAEIMSLKMLSCLNSRVKKIHSPGIHVNMRIEDYTGFYMFRDEGEDGKKSSIKYVDDLCKLINILGLDDIILPIKETSYVGKLFSDDDFMAIVKMAKMNILAYLIESEEPASEPYYSLPSFMELKAMGWQGTIPMEQREYYYRSYEKIYGIPRTEQRIKLAEYFAMSFARYKLNFRGMPEDVWGDSFIDLTFCPPVPGVPESIDSRRVYYRTIYAKYTREHMPPWRCRGYLRIRNDNVTTPAIASFNSTDVFDTVKVNLTGNGESIDMDVDYQLI